MAKRIKKPIGKIGKTGKIPSPKDSLSVDCSLTFSFKHLELNKEKFSVEAQGGKYLRKLLERLNALSSMTCKEFTSNRNSALRSHPIDWTDTTEPNGFECLNSQLQDETPYQFEISANKWGRVHGIIVGNIFYIIWFDPKHLLYS